MITATTSNTFNPTTTDPKTSLVRFPGILYSRGPALRRTSRSSDPLATFILKLKKSHIRW